MTASLTKSPDALRTIREVADELSLEPHVLRFWEKEFPKQISPMQRGSGRRYYRRKDVEQIRHIQILLHEQGYTIKGARAVLSGKAEAPVIVVSEPKSTNALQGELEQLHQQILQLREKISTVV